MIKWEKTAPDLDVHCKNKYTHHGYAGLRKILRDDAIDHLASMLVWLKEGNQNVVPTRNFYFLPYQRHHTTMVVSVVWSYFLLILMMHMHAPLIINKDGWSSHIYHLVYKDVLHRHKGHGAPVLECKSSAWIHPYVSHGAILKLCRICQLLHVLLLQTIMPLPSTKHLEWSWLPGGGQCTINELVKIILGTKDDPCPTFVKVSPSHHRNAR
jgi:hypothetical protein